MSVPGPGGTQADRPVRIVRVIARMNVGGPAHHVSLLSSRLDAARYETVLVRGRVGSGEASFDELVDSGVVQVRTLPTLAPELHPIRDLRALASLVRLMRELRPDIVHTHTAKAGMLGRTAARLARNCSPVVVHTYHGHVLEGYFGPLKNRLFRTIERVLARASDCLIGVSDATVDDLVRLGVAERSKFRVVPLGLDLTGFLALPGEPDAAVRRELGVPDGELLGAYAGRLAPIKRIDMALRALSRAREQGAKVSLLVVGDGTERPVAERLAAELGVTGAVFFLGYRKDLDRILSGVDFALLTSDNEGTPVFLIEAAAAARPSVATSVGGVPAVVTAETGHLAPAGDSAGIAEGMVRLAGDSTERRALGAHARDRVRERFSVERLLDDIDRLYRELLEQRGR